MTPLLMNPCEQIQKSEPIFISQETTSGPAHLALRLASTQDSQSPASARLRQRRSAASQAATVATGTTVRASSCVESVQAEMARIRRDFTAELAGLFTRINVIDSQVDRLAEFMVTSSSLPEEVEAITCASSGATARSPVPSSAINPQGGRKPKPPLCLVTKKLRRNDASRAYSRDSDSPSTASTLSTDSSSLLDQFDCEASSETAFSTLISCPDDTTSMSVFSDACTDSWTREATFAYGLLAVKKAGLQVRDRSTDARSSVAVHMTKYNQQPETMPQPVPIDVACKRPNGKPDQPVNRKVKTKVLPRSK
ncbi:unnamed protein product [Protopolystoma xenopodis]|uniref:Uncharacterized protein n=1 Tax=Protopolystoma xenopodis TaxID=117903 RepID=A0A448WAZ7_9PLAT|nr:unnamed protein product [Protopolystoma xenopodis]